MESTVGLPDGTLLTAFGMGFRNPEKAASGKMEGMPRGMAATSGSSPHLRASPGRGSTFR